MLLCFRPGVATCVIDLQARTWFRWMDHDYSVIDYDEQRLVIHETLFDPSVQRFSLLQER